MPPPAAESKSLGTLDTYLRTVRLFAPLLASQDMPHDIAANRRGIAGPRAGPAGSHVVLGPIKVEGELEILPPHRMRPQKS